MNPNAYNNLSKEDMIKRAKKMQEAADKDLDEMLKNDPDLKDINFDDDLDIEDSDEDPELKALEEEDKIERNKNKVNLKEKTDKNNDNNINVEPKKQEFNDLYPLEVERLYHNKDNIKSITALEYEKEKVSEIINYKKDNNLDSMFWETKKVALLMMINKIQDDASEGKLDPEQYKGMIESQLEFEKKILVKIDSLNSISEEAKNTAKQRINSRIEKINTELTAEQEEEQEQEEQEQEQNNDADQSTNNINKHEKTKAEENENSNVNNRSIEDVKIFTYKNNKNNVDQSEIDINGNENIKKDIKLVKKATCKIVDTELRKNVENKFNHYLKAKEYCLKNNFTERAEEANKRLAIIRTELKNIEKGEDINEFNLPIDITPDFINGCDKQERLKKYYEISKSFMDRKNAVNSNLQDFANKIKSLDKREFEKSKEGIKTAIEQKKKRIETYEKILRKLIDDQKNPWIPPPLFGYEEETEKIEVVNEDIPQFTMEIYIGKNNYLKENSYLYLEFEISDKRTHTEYIYPKTVEEYDKKVILKFDKSEFKSIFRKSINLSIYKSR